MSLKLYYAPGACSFVPHASLELAGADFEPVMVKLHKGEQGTNSTKTTIDRCRRAEDLGADALLVTVPYYSKPTLKGVVDHFKQIAGSVSTPVIVDDDPHRTAIDYGSALPLHLSEFDIVVGICHGNDRKAHFSRLPSALKNRFLHLSRDDATLFRSCNLVGTVSCRHWQM